jgi:hypothetical protein
MALAVLDPDAEQVVSRWEDERYRLCRELSYRLAQQSGCLDRSIDEAAGLLWSLTSYQMFERLMLTFGSESQVFAAMRSLTVSLRAGHPSSVAPWAS